MSYHERAPFWKDLLQAGLREDRYFWDWSTRGALSGRAEKKLRARIVAKSPGVWAGQGLTDELPFLAAEMGAELKVNTSLRDGNELKKGQLVCEWEGPGAAILALERPYLNLVSYAGGIATKTRALVRAVARAARHAQPPRVACTRKILPLYRDLAIVAVQAGGGHSHRLDLSGGVLIKENHITVAGSIARAIHGAREAAPHGLKIEVEVKTQKELSEAIENGADGVLLDNFSPAQVKSALKRVSDPARNVFVEVSGGIDESNIAKYVLPGVNVISSGAITHSVRALDLSLLLV